MTALSAPRRPARPRPSIGGFALLAVAAVITIVTGSAIGVTLLPLFDIDPRAAGLIAQFFQPNWAFLPRIVSPMLVTLATAVVATAFGCAIALVVAMFNSPVTARNPLVYRVSKFVMSILRSLPDVVWGMLFVAFVGVGALAGVLALIMFNIGIVAKLTAETIDAIDPGPLEAVDAAGAGTIQRARVAVVPQILPNFASYSMYIFELNVRASVVLGIVGAGGIGTTLIVENGRFNYDNVSAIIVVLLVVVFLIDLLSQWLRRRLAR